MKYPTRLSDAAHILIFIHLNPTQNLSSTAIAKSILTNPSYVRQLMASMKKAGLLNSSQGIATPSLACAPDQISLLAIYRAVEGDKPLLHQDTHTNPECGVGVSIQQTLRKYFDQVQQQAEQEMERITLQHIIDSFQQCRCNP